MMMGVYHFILLLCLFSIDVTLADGNADNSSSTSIEVGASSTSSVRRYTPTINTGSINTASSDRDIKLMSVLAARRNALLLRNRSRQSQSHHHHYNHHRNQQKNTTDEQSPNISGPLSQRVECEKNCTRNFTARSSAGCMRKCAMQYKIVLANNYNNRTTLVNTRNSSNIDSIIVSVNSSKSKINEDKESNTIADELLETEESQSTGLYFVPNTGNSNSKSVPMKFAPNNVSPFDTKESENGSTSATASSPSSTTKTASTSTPTTTNQLYKNNSYKNNVIENEVRQSSTEKIYLKFLRTTLEARHKRVDPSVTAAMISKARQKNLQTTPSSSSSPTTSSKILLTSEKSVEDSDLAPYLSFGEKLQGTKTTELRNQKLTEPLNFAAKPTRAKLKSSEEMIILDSPKPVTVSERSNKFRRFNPHTRNIVALSRKYGGTIPKDVWEQAAAGNNPIDPIIVPKVPSSDSSSDDAKMKLPNDLKIFNLTIEAVNETKTEPPIVEPLLIQVPDIASRFGEDLLIQTPSPIPVINTNKEIEQETKRAVDLPKIIREPVDIPTTTTTPVNPVTLKKINYTVNRHQPEETPNLIVFLQPQNATLQTQINENEKQPDLLKVIANNVQQIHNVQPEAVTPKENQAFTRTTVSSSIRSTVNPVGQNHTIDMEEVFPVNPHQLKTTATTTILTTTEIIHPTALSTTLKTTYGPTPETTTPISSTVKTTVTPTTTITTTTASSNTTIFNLSAIFPNFSGLNPNIPALPDMSTIFMQTVSNSSKKPVIMVDGVLLTNNNDVTIEMHRMNMATYVLAGLGMFPIVIIVLYVIKTVLFRRHSKTGSELERYITDGHKPISPVVRLEDSSGQSSYSGDESIGSEENFNRNYLKFKSLLGEGNFGQVWKAEADDLTGHLGTTRIVAVKTERGGLKNEHGGLKDEAEIMKKLGSHINVVTLLGACLEKEPHLLIMEFAMRGRLLSLLRAAKSATNSPPSTQGVRNLAPLSPRRLAGFAHDIARGMEYISEKKIVHRDLAARNVLLDHNGVCKICDFGMSIDLDKTKSTHKRTITADTLRHQASPEPHRFRFDFHRRSFCMERKANDHCTKRPALPIRWMAPEALQYHIFSPETDVWAFGIVLWEISTLGCTPYPTLTGREVVRSVPNGTRPDIPIDVRPELYELMSRTWCKDPRKRPTFSEARMELGRSLCQWEIEDTSSDYLDVSGFSEDLEHGVVYFNRRISEFECEI